MTKRLACGTKNARQTITAAGEHKPALWQAGQLPFVGTIRVRCRTAFVCAVLGVRARSPFLSLVWAPPAGMSYHSTEPGRMQGRQAGRRAGPWRATDIFLTYLMGNVCRTTHAPRAVRGYGQ
ncbi:hypothetical protein DWUX_2562 [Desulfovibrio diazotrophicus]|nr:hypothetical protein DWUX_2562 [Desulfovibrio diazotrophicus]